MAMLTSIRRAGAGIILTYFAKTPPEDSGETPPRRCGHVRESVRGIPQENLEIKKSREGGSCQVGDPHAQRTTYRTIQVEIAPTDDDFRARVSWV